MYIDRAIEGRWYRKLSPFLIQRTTSSGQHDILSLTEATSDNARSGVLSNLNQKKVMVTGGAGFIGSWLCDSLVSSGAVVHCVDNLCTGVEENIRHLRGHPNFKFEISDVTKAGQSFGEYDVIVHLASRASPEDYQQHPVETLAANSVGVENMLQVTRKNDAIFVYASSSEVYGDADMVPTPESYWGNVNPIGLRSCYDEGKRYGEALCMAYKRTYSLDMCIARIFNTYGPRIRADAAYGRAIPRFITQALTGESITVFGDGGQTRSFCYVSDTVGALLRIMTTQAANGEVLNIGNPDEITIAALALKIKKTTGSASKVVYRPLPPDDPKRRCPDIAKANRILAWQPTVKLDDGLSSTISWFKNRQVPS